MRFCFDNTNEHGCKCEVMVETVMCEEIAHEKLKDLLLDEELLNLEQKAQEDVVLGFGKSVSDLLDKYLSEYDTEAACFEEGIRTTNGFFLIARALDTIRPAYQTVLDHHQSRALDTFKMSLDSALQTDSNEGFADIARHCSEIVLTEFDRGCVGAIPLPRSLVFMACLIPILIGLRGKGWDFNKESSTLEHLCFVSLD